MKRYIAFLLLTVAYTSAFAASDTLRMYNKKDIPGYYRQPDIRMQAARFDLKQNARLQSIRIMLGGKSSHGTARIHIFGREGGSPVPVLETDLIPPVTITKLHTGNEWIEIFLPGQGVELSSQQFFIAISSLSDGIALLTDKTKHPAVCSSPTGGVFLSQAIKHSDGRWEQGNFNYFVEAGLVYEQNRTPTLTLDSNAIITSDSTSLRAFTGISAGDIDQDGFIDIMSNGKLYHNDGKGRLKDISLAVSMPPISRSQVFLDIDNDGDLDILCLLPESAQEAILLTNTGRAVMKFL